MEVFLKDVGKNFNRNWIFRHVNATFESGGKYAITGNNGSGKTTLLKILAGIIPLTEGEVIYKYDDKIFSDSSFFQHITLAGPYTELIEEFNIQEIFTFYNKFKKLSVSLEELLRITNFSHASKLQIKNFSSGMKQKLKITLALFTQNRLVLLDEPTSNFDKKNIDWYLDIIKKTTKDKTVIICSNQEYEYSFCQNVINVNNFK